MPGDAKRGPRSASITEVRAHLSAILRDVERGGEVLITRRGRPVARLLPASQPRKPIDFSRLAALRAKLPMDQERSVDLIRRMRDEGY